MQQRPAALFSLAFTMENFKLKPVSLQEANAAAARLKSAGRASPLRTPLVKLNYNETNVNNNEDDLEIYLKLENLQSIGSFKVRGAGNAILQADPDVIKKNGVATASAGNMGQGVARVAQLLGAPCTVVVPDTAPDTKVAAVERLGGHVLKVPYSEWWNIIETGDCPLTPGALFVHPVLDQRVLAGNSTIGLEIMEDLPDVDAILVPYGGGGLACGISSVIKAAQKAGTIKESCRVLACEPSTAAPLVESFRTGICSEVDYQPSFVDGCGGKAVLSPMWPLAQEVLDGSLAVDLDDAAAAVKILAERNRIIAEGAGALPVAAALAGRAGKTGKVVCVISGGGLDTTKLIQILEGCRPNANVSTKSKDNECAAKERTFWTGVAYGAFISSIFVMTGITIIRGE